MKRARIIIDVATIYPGKGGAGGGIWNYAKNLLLQLDSVSEKLDIEFLCLVNDKFDLPLKSIKIKILTFNFQNFLVRLFYTHLYLPIYVLYKKSILHKLYFESPIFLPSRIIVTIHDCMMNFYKQKNYTGYSVTDKLKFMYFNFMNKRAISQSHFICTPSNFVKEEIIRLYKVVADKILVTPLAANDRGYQQEKKKITKNVKLYCVAAFHKHKGHLRLLEIFEEMVVTYGIDVDLYLRGHVSDDDYYEKIILKISSYTSKNRIHILEYEAQYSLRDIYADADWVILLSEYEGFGLPVIEAQANHISVICSDIPTFKEVAGDSAYYIDEGDGTSKAAEKLFNLLNNENKKKELIELGLKNSAKYNWSFFSNQMIGIYKRATA